jgi:hypothetical protein
MVSLRAFQDVDIDAEKRIARLGAGLRLDEVHTLLYDHGLSMPATGSILEVSVGVSIVYTYSDHHPVSLLFVPEFSHITVYSASECRSLLMICIGMFLWI